MKVWSLFLLRVSLGLLLVFWGLDKLVNVDHSIRVAELSNRRSEFSS